MKRRDFIKLLGLAPIAAKLGWKATQAEPEPELVDPRGAVRTDVIADGPVFGTSRVSKAPAKVFVSGEYAEVAQAIIEAQWDCAYDEFGRCIPNT